MLSVHCSFTVELLKKTSQLHKCVISVSLGFDSQDIKHPLSDSPVGKCSKFIMYLTRYNQLCVTVKCLHIQYQSSDIMLKVQVNCTQS